MTRAELVLIFGGNEFASAIAEALVKSRVPVVMVIHPQETPLRRSICFSEAVLSGQKEIQGVTAVPINENLLSQFSTNDLSGRWQSAIQYCINNRSLPVFLENEFPEYIAVLRPQIIIKSHPDFFVNYPLDSASLVIGLHPWHLVNQHCHFAVESRSNSQLGEIFFQPPVLLPEFDTHFFRNPFEEIRSPLEGAFISLKDIGDKIQHHEAIGTIQEIQIRSPYDGQIWGLVHGGRMIRVKQPLALVYQGTSSNAYNFFDYRHKAVAGTVLKEILHFFRK
jgi:xanthine dehydrogenase accessory factor